MTIRKIYDEQRQESTTIGRLQNKNADALILQAIYAYHFTDYAKRKFLIGENTGQNPQTVVGLIRAVELLNLVKPVVEDIWTFACKGYDRQATNLSEHQTCEELTNGSSSNSESDSNNTNNSNNTRTGSGE